jgi:hypothetical protein
LPKGGHFLYLPAQPKGLPPDSEISPGGRGMAIDTYTFKKSSPVNLEYSTILSHTENLLL